MCGGAPPRFSQRRGGARAHGRTTSVGVLGRVDERLAPLTGDEAYADLLALRRRRRRGRGRASATSTSGAARGPAHRTDLRRARRGRVLGQWQLVHHIGVPVNRIERCRGQRRAGLERRGRRVDLRPRVRVSDGSQRAATRLLLARPTQDASSAAVMGGSLQGTRVPRVLSSPRPSGPSAAASPCPSPACD